MALGQVWLTNSLGGFMWSANLSKVLRTAVQPLVKFRQFADIKDAAVQGKGKGQTFQWNVYSDIATQGTTLTETSTMPESNFTVTQGTMTITEYGNSVPFTEKLDDLSLHPVREVIQKVLKNDCKKALDQAAYNQFNLAPLTVVPTGGTSTTALTLTTNGTATLTNNIALGNAHVKLIVDLMKERNIPPYMGDDYICVAHPSTLRTFKNNLEDVRKYVDVGYQNVLNGEVGRHENTRFVEQTNIVKEAFTNALSNQAFFFGADTVAEGIVIPEEMRGKIPTDFGRSRGIAWYYVGGFGIVHSVAVAGTSAKNARIVKWASVV